MAIALAAMRGVERTRVMLQRVTRGSQHKWFVLVTLTLGSFVSVVVGSAVNVALPAIASDFGEALTVVQWVAVAVPLMTSVFLMPVGYAADVTGRKRVYMLGLTAFVAASVLAGLAPSMGLLIAARLGQGVSMAMVSANSVAIMVSVFPPSERGKVLGITSAVVGLSAVIAPAVGGLLVDALGWRWVFHVMAVPAALGVVLVLVVLDEQRMVGSGAAVARRAFDWFGTATLGGGVVGIVLALTRGPDAGWGAPIVWGSATGGALLLATFVWGELVTDHPLFDLRLLARRALGFSLGSRVLTLLGHSGVLFIVPFQVQGVLGYSASELGLILVPGFVVYAAIAAFAGRLSDRFGARRFLVAAPLLGAAGTLGLALLPVQAPLAGLVAALIAQQAGMGGYMSPSMSAVLGAVPSTVYSSAVAFTALVGTVASVASVGAGTAIVAATMHAHGFEAAVTLGATAGAVGPESAAFAAGARIAYCVFAGWMLLSAATGYAYRARGPAAELEAIEGSTSSEA